MTFNLGSIRSVFQPTTRQRGDNLLDDFFYNSERRAPYFSTPNKETGFCPQLDIYETNSEYNISFDLPGVSKKDIELKVDNNILTIKGKKEFDEEYKDNNFYIRERFDGDFHRVINLPSDADTGEPPRDKPRGIKSALSRVQITPALNSQGLLQPWDKPHRFAFAL